MSSAWLSSDSWQDSDAFSDRFWSRHREELAAGKFWAEHITGYRDKPSERLRFAIENLPLPGAFREAAVALRSLIKARKKRNERFSGDLACLYWLAAIASFSMPYSQRSAEPGFNVLQSIPGTVVAGLPFTYRQLGHQRLSLLNKTDVKWIEAEWGVPSAHSTLLDLHRSVWELYEEALVKRRDSARKQFIESIKDILS